ncbi:MAG: hypothetical protein SGJ18_01945 [Pseudomonadota bacterium]|nr:hypothetical protein [Pseudomonadota bacterium]
MGFSLITLGSFASAQDAAKEPKGSKVKKTTIDFEDELVEGEFKKPELFYLLQRKQFNYKRLIKLRKDFIPEMKQTAEDVEDVDGGGE